MRREDYYRSNANNNSRENYHRNDYQSQNQEQPQQGTPGAMYNNYAPQQPAPYYPPREHHHVFLWILVVILCLFLGWFAADHFLGGDNQASNAPTTYKTYNNKTVNNTTKNNTTKKAAQPKVNKLENEMNDLGVSQSDQAQALKFYENQDQANQEKIDKIIVLINKIVPSDTLKRDALNWVLQ